jgi:hypothetical protein
VRLDASGLGAEKLTTQLMRPTLGYLRAAGVSGAQVKYVNRQLIVPFHQIGAEAIRFLRRLW